MKKTKRILVVAAIIAVLALVFTTYFGGYKRAEERYRTEVERLSAELSDLVAAYESASAEVNLSVIHTELRAIGELATVEYMYTNAGKYSDPKQLFGYDIPFTTKSFIAKWDGVIKAGVDVTRISVEPDEEEKKLVVYLPQAEILSHEIDSESIETLDESDGLFNPVRVEDVRKFDAVSKDSMEQRAIDKGLLEGALERTQEIISGLLNANPAIRENYSIEFSILPEQAQAA